MTQSLNATANNQMLENDVAKDSLSMQILAKDVENDLSSNIEEQCIVTSVDVESQLLDTSPRSITFDNKASSKPEQTTLENPGAWTSDTSHETKANATRHRVNGRVDADAEKQKLSLSSSNELIDVDTEDNGRPHMPRVSVTIIDGITIIETQVTWHQRLRTLLPIIIMFIIYIVVLVLFFVFQSRIFPVLQNWAGWLENAGAG
jgi:hypothetical protein